MLVVMMAKIEKRGHNNYSIVGTFHQTNRTSIHVQIVLDNVFSIHIKRTVVIYEQSINSD